MVEHPILGHEGYRGRLAIPYLTESGPINMGFRCLKDHNHKSVGCPKYLKLEGAPVNLYYVQAYYDAHEYIAVTEGELDALVLNMIGIPAIGVPGAENWADHWNLIFQDFQKIFTFSDGDDAGQDFAKKVASEVRGINIPMPDGLDVNEAYIKYGAEWLHGRIAE